MSTSSYFRLGSTGFGILLESALNAAAHGYEAGTPVVTAHPTGTAADGELLWALGGSGMILHVASSLVLGVKDASTADGAPLELQLATGEPHQQWTVQPDTSIVNGLGHRALHNGDVNPGHQLTVRTPNHEPSQMWWIAREGARAAIQNRAIALSEGASVLTPAASLGSQELTFEAWVRTGTAGPVMSSVVGPHQQGIVVAIEGDGSLLFGLNSPQTGVSLVARTVPTSLLDGEWHHIACVRSAETGGIVIDGVKVPLAWADMPRFPVPVPPGQLIFGQAVRPQPITSPDEPFSGWELNSYQLHGELDDLRLWTIARSVEEIAANRHVIPPKDVPGLLAHWSFDAGDAADTGRSQGPRLDGTPNGPVTWTPCEVYLNTEPGPYLFSEARVNPVDQSFRVNIRGYDADDRPLLSFLVFASQDDCTLVSGRAKVAIGPRSGNVLLPVRGGELVGNLTSAGGTFPRLYVRPDFLPPAAPWIPVTEDV